MMGLEKVFANIKHSGVQLGEQQAQEQIAKQLLAEQLDKELISRATGLPLQKIEQLSHETR